MRLNTKCLYELIIHFGAFINLRYNVLGQLEYVQRDDRSFLTQIDYIYDHEGNLFLKRSDYGGKLREIHQIDGSYRIYTLKDREVHEIIFNKESEILGHFRFSGRHHLAMNPSMYYNRMLAGIKRLFIKSSYKDIASLMGALYYITDNTKAMLEQIDTKEIKYLYERQKEAIYYFVLFILILLTIYIIYQNNQHYESEYSYLMQIIAFVLIIIFYQSCIPRPEKRPKIEYALLGQNNQNLLTTGFMGPIPAPDNNIPMEVLIPDKGVYYYVNGLNGSTEFVLNRYGKPLARYVYEPYGKINPYLTNLDLDKNQYFYKGKFYYTGMEWEEELQLYNFKARYYDPYTMRFIQPDPVHTERTGFDNYDRYSYVNNNPVNFVDPDGRAMCSGNAIALITGGIGLMLGGIAGGVVGAAGLGVIGNYTGGGGNCSTRIVTKWEHMISLLLYFSVLWATDLVGILSGKIVENEPQEKNLLIKGLLQIWDYIEEQPSFVHKYSQEDIKLGPLGEYNKLGILSLLMYQKSTSDNNPHNDIYPVLMYLMMTDGISHPRFGIDEASYFHDIYGSSPLNPKSKKANQAWINRANREIFSHDSFNRVFKREFKALGKKCGNVRDLCAGINTIFSWSGQAIITIAGNITFQIANLFN